MNIITGHETGRFPACADGHPVRGRELGRNLVFHPDSRLDEPYSRRVPIHPGTASLFTVHGLPPDRRVFTHQVVVGRDSLSAADFFRVRMRLGGEDPWVFTRERPQKIITLPGTYRFELEDMDLLGEDFAMEYVTWNLSECPVQGLVVY
jgi:hypothetical protein